MHNYRLKHGLATDPEGTVARDTFPGLMESWPCSGDIHVTVAHGEKTLAAWRQGLTMKEFGKRIYQMRMEWDRADNVAWRGKVRVISKNAASLLHRCEALADLAFEHDPSGRRGLYNAASALRAKATRAVCAIDEVILLENSSLKSLENAYNNQDLDFFRA